MAFRPQASHCPPAGVNCYSCCISSPPRSNTSFERLDRQPVGSLLAIHPAVNIPRSWYRHNRYSVFNRQGFPGFAGGSSSPRATLSSTPVGERADLTLVDRSLTVMVDVARHAELYGLECRGFRSQSDTFHPGIENTDPRPSQCGPHSARRSAVARLVRHRWSCLPRLTERSQWDPHPWLRRCE